MEKESPNKYELTKHYFNKLLSLPSSKFEHSHIMIVYFATYGLSLTNSLPKSEAQKLSKYVLTLEIPRGGFVPSPFYTNYEKQNKKFMLPHIVFTYSALNILKICGGIQKINKQKVLESVERCFRSDGSYVNFENSEQSDVRFVYAAVAIYDVLDAVGQIKEKSKTVQFLEKCQNFDGGYGLNPYRESHCGATYCAIASLKLLNEQFPKKNLTINFLVNRQIHNLSTPQIVGVQGRVGKYPDSCYTFWMGASLQIITGKTLINDKILNFLETCFKEKQCSFGKYPTGEIGDPMHTLHSVVGSMILKGCCEGLDLEKGNVRKYEKV